MNQPNRHPSAAGDAGRADAASGAAWLAGATAVALAIGGSERGWAAACGLAVAVWALIVAVGASTRPRAWIGFVAAASVLACAGGPLSQEPLPWLLGALALQLAAGLFAPSIVAAGLGGAAIGGAALVGMRYVAAPPGWTEGVAFALFGVGAALAASHGRGGAGGERPVAATAEPSESARGELEQARRELDALAEQLRSEVRQRRRAEEQVVAAVRTRNGFLSVMSHELRTPLNQIIGYSELLREELAEEAGGRFAADVERIHVASLNLLEVIGNLLDLSKIEAGRVTVSAEEFDAGELMDNLIASFEGRARQRGNVLRVRQPERPIRLRTDRAKLRTILANILGNACKFTRDGTVRMALREETDAAVFEISDTGIGIPLDRVDRIFATFVQGEEGPTRRHDGPGLGLAIARQLCAMLGGEIRVESEPGRGSKFQIRLPREFIDPRHAGHVQRSLG